MGTVWEVPRVAEHGPWGHGAVGRWEVGRLVPMALTRDEEVAQQALG